MTFIKKSFLSNVVGNNTYDILRPFALIISAIGTCVLAALFLLSFFFHWGFLSRLLNLTMGSSLLFIVYIIAVIIALDKEVDVYELDEYDISEPNRSKKTAAYKLTVFRGVVLIVLGISAVIFSDKYKRQYAFECSTVFVDKESGIYHLKWVDKCEVAAASEDLVKMKGYEIKGKNYKLCGWCEEYEEDVNYALFGLNDNE